MGRYYNTNERDGKFMFGVQPSDDPGTMGMHEAEPATIEYYADEDDVEEIKKNLDRQYDLLGVDEKDRIYYKSQDIEEYSRWEEEKLHDKVWRTVKHEDLTDEERTKVFWASNKGADYTDLEIEDGRCLALARIRLALTILSDIKDSGECALSAEL